MELRQFRYFLSVAGERNFSRASERLHVSQPALSRQIQMLEEEIGVQLLSRTAKGVEMTEAGLRFREMAEFVVRYVADIGPTINQFANEPAGIVALGLTPSLIPLLGARLADETNRRFPQIDLRITEGLSMFLCEWIGQSRLDIAVFTDMGPVLGMERSELAKDEIVFVGAPSLLKDYDMSIPQEDIANFPLIVTPGFRQIFRSSLKEGAEPKYQREMDSILIVKNIVLRGRYCSIVPYTFVHEEVMQGKLKALHFHSQPIYRRIVDGVRTNHPLSLAIKTVRELIKDELRKLPELPPR